MKLLLLGIACVVIFCNAVGNIKEIDLVKMVQTNPEILEYWRLLKKNNNSKLAIFFEKNNQENLVQIYVGEKFEKENRYVRFSTFFYDKKNEYLLKLDFLNNKKAKVDSNKAILASVEVDSYFDSYSKNPINDGFILVEGKKYNKSAWASSETDNEHFIKMTWDKPKTINQVVIYWGYDNEKYFISKKIYIEGYFGSRKRNLNFTIKIDEDFGSSHIVLESYVELDKLIVIQKNNGGSKNRPGLMWVREVCIY